MKRILILGCGRSSTNLIEYLLQLGSTYSWHIRIGDADVSLAQQKLKDATEASFLKFDVFDQELKEKEIREADLVISMLPAHFHIEIVKSCIKFKRNMLSASYISDDIRSLKNAIEEQNILILKECGLDPGLDHMSAMQIIDDIKDRGGKITAFKSYTGGLIAPESDNNPWNYKFTWNPRNVVIAGQGTARYISNNQLKYIPYHKLFSRTDAVTVPGYGAFEGYANRDSLSYRKIYGIENVPTLLRGTLRKPGFCSAWNIFVQLGVTDDSYIIQESESMTYREFINAFLPYDEKASVEEKLYIYTGKDENSDEMKKLAWLGVFENKKIGIPKATPAAILQKILEEKWVLEPQDKDMIVMQHQFEFMMENNPQIIYSELVVTGDDPVHTAMSKTVGLPLGIAAKLILTDQILIKGLHIPILKEIYEPVLKELSNIGITFHHR